MKEETVNYIILTVASLVFIRGIICIINLEKEKKKTCFLIEVEKQIKNNCKVEYEKYTNTKK